MRFLNGVWQDERDSQPMGEPETRIDLPGDLTLGLYIPAPFGRSTDAVLAVRAIENGDQGGVITLAITNVIERSTPVRVDVNLQSNPRRADDDEPDRGQGELDA